MVRPITTLLIGLLLAAAPAQLAAWYSWAGEYDLVHIAAVNQADTSPTDDDVAPDGVSVKLPATIYVRVKESDLYSVAVTDVKLQYKDPAGDNTWRDFGPTYSDPARSYLFADNQTAFGREALHADLTDVSPGDTLLVRLYIAHDTGGGVSNQNASLTADTTAEGTNGWRDQWVVEIQTQTNQRPTWGDL